MYLDYYNLSEKPFNINTDPRFLWRGEKHQEALANLKYGLLEANGYVVLTGDVGTGKTTLVNALIASLDDNVVVADINHPTLDTVEFLTLIAKTYDASAEIGSKTEFLFFFRNFLQKARAAGSVVLLVIDEAHRLSKEILEEIRLLSNMEKAGQKLINIFFVGQNELKEVLLSSHCRALRQRITLFYDIEPLSENETRAYVTHRLMVAGTETQIFTAAAIGEIQKFTKGYPRLINIICDRALLTGYVKERKEIDADIVVECAREISFLDPMASKIRRSQIEKFSSWGGPLVAGLRVPAAVFKSRGAQQRGPAENAPPDGNYSEEGDQPAAAWPRKYNRYKMLPIGLTALFALIIFAVVIARQTDTPTEKNAPVKLEQTLPHTNPQSQDRRAASAASLEPRNTTESITETSQAESSREASPPSKQDPVAEAENENPPADLQRGEAATAAIVIEPGEDPVAKDESPEKIFKQTPPASEGGAEAISEKLPRPTTLEMASAALAESNFQTAIELLEADRNRDSANYLKAREIYSSALVGRAEQIMEASPDEAEAMLRKAGDMNPKNVEAHVTLGKIYTRSKDYALAIDAYQKAVALNPKLSDAYFNLGFIFATTGLYSDAEKLFERVIQLAPPYNDKAHFNLAVIQDKLGKRKECLANLQMAVMINPDNQKAQNYLKQLADAAEESR